MRSRNPSCPCSPGESLAARADDDGAEVVEHYAAVSEQCLLDVDEYAENACLGIVEALAMLFN